MGNLSLSNQDTARAEQEWWQPPTHSLLLPSLAVLLHFISPHNSSTTGVKNRSIFRGLFTSEYFVPVFELTILLGLGVVGRATISASLGVYAQNSSN